MEFDLDARPTGPELGERRGEKRRADGLEDADPERADLANRQGVEIGADGSDAGGDVLGVAEHDLTGWRERDGSSPAGPFDEPVTTAFSSVAICCEMALCAYPRLAAACENDCVRAIASSATRCRISTPRI